MENQKDKTCHKLPRRKIAAVTNIHMKDITKSVTPPPDRHPNPDTGRASVDTQASVTFKQTSTPPFAPCITVTRKPPAPDFSKRTTPIAAESPGHHFFPFLRALIPVLLAVGCAAPHSSESETLLPGRNVLHAREVSVAMQGTVDFSRHVKPILAAKCVACHNSESQPQGLHFNNYASATKSGALGVYIVPGHPERSPFLTTIKSAHTSITSMPPVGERLTSEEVGILKRWIQQGARWPGSE